MNNDRFSRIVDKTIAAEGGYVNDPKDPGGETKYGISKRSHPNYNIGALTIEDARIIYFRDYWMRPGIHLIKDDELAGRVFDVGVLCGPARAIRFLQSAANTLGGELAWDGIMGPFTTDAVNHCRHPKALLALVKMYAAQYFVQLEKPRFRAGWLARLEN